MKLNIEELVKNIGDKWEEMDDENAKSGSSYSIPRENIDFMVRTEIQNWLNKNTNQNPPELIDDIGAL